MTSVIRWEDPPEPRRTGRRPTKAWSEVADELRARPGEWGVVYEGSGGHALPSRINRGTGGGFTPAGHFESTLRGAGLSTVVYARYVGGGQ